MKTHIVILLLLISQTLTAQNCLPGWSHFRPINIYQPAGDSLNDCQVRFTLNTGALVSAGKLQASGADLRITDSNCNLLPYFMDSLATDTVNVIWVRVPQIPAGDTVALQLYYGHAAAEAFANGDSTFAFFDDFSADSVNPAKWEPIGGYTNFEVVDGVLNYSSNGSNPGPRFKFARTKMQFSEAMHFDFNAKVSNSNGFGFSSGDSTLQRIIFRQAGFGFDTLNQVALLLDTVSNGFQVEGLYPFIRFPRNRFNHTSIRAGIQDTLLTLDHFANYTEDQVADSVYQLTQIKMNSFHFIVSSFLGSQTAFLDYLRVRKPVPDAVSVSLGTEVVLIASSIADELVPTYNIRLSPNPAHRHLHITGLPAGTHALQLVNAQGQTVYRTRPTSIADQALQVELPEIAKGLYWITLTDQAAIRYSQAILIQAE